MEAVLALSGRQPQLLLHNLLAGVVRQLEIVGAGHHAGQVVVRVHLHQQVTTDCIALFYCIESWELGDKKQLNCCISALLTLRTCAALWLAG